MSEQHDIRSQNEVQFRQIVLRVLEAAGFEPYVPGKKLFSPQPPEGLLKKGDNIYCLETFYSRRAQYTSRAILVSGENLISQSKNQSWLPLVVVGGVLSPTLWGDLLGKSVRTVVLDIENLLYMARENRELYDELVAKLPYSVGGLRQREPDFLPLPDWNAAYASLDDWEITVCSFHPEKEAGHFPAKKEEDSFETGKNSPLPGVLVQDSSGSMIAPDFPPLRLTIDGTGETKLYSKREVTVGRDASNDLHITGDSYISRKHAIFRCEFPNWFVEDNLSVNGTFVNGVRLNPGDRHCLENNDRISVGKQKVIIFHNTVGDEQTHTEVTALPGHGEEVPEKPEYTPPKEDTGNKPVSDKFGGLRKDIHEWKGGKQSASAAYEKLCTRTLIRLFADDLSLWKEQARSNDDLFRFDLICKIKRDNHKDFWEMAERYFNSKYIIFEFKNYSGKVTQKEVYSTVRYLYTKAMRGIAILISPNGIDDHADKAIRGVIRDEGKLILSLTNDELIAMLEMKENGEDPADYLSDKLDALMIDLEK